MFSCSLFGFDLVFCGLVVGGFGLVLRSILGWVNSVVLLLVLPLKLTFDIIGGVSCWALLVCICDCLVGL